MEEQPKLPVVVKGWRERAKEIGRDALSLEEMVRLGFWPPNEEKAAEFEVINKEIKRASKNLSDVQRRLESFDQKVENLESVPEMLKEIRRRRIERVRKERELRRQRKKEEQARKEKEDQEWRADTLPHLGRGVSRGLKYSGGSQELLDGHGLPRLMTPKDLAAAMKIDTSQLAWLSYHRTDASVDHYHRFEIPKRNGGTRVISSPKPKLRAAQSWILENVLSNVAPSEQATAFRPGSSILQNAEMHSGKSVVIRIDLKDFFPSITFRRVKGLFHSLGYNEGIATILALLATESPRVTADLDGERRYIALGERRLPQGACTSPAISNLVPRKLDHRLQALAGKFGFTYSRYADDLVFSHKKSSAPVGMILKLVGRIVGEEGFEINEKKTSVMRPSNRQAVTGVVVNEVPRVSRRDVRRFRAFLHQCETKGFDVMSERVGCDSRAHAQGYLAFIQMINHAQADALRRRHSWLALETRD